MTTTPAMRTTATSVVFALALAGVTGGCGDSGKDDRRPLARQTRVGAPLPFEGEPADAPTVPSVVPADAPAVPSVVANQYGTMSTAAYQGIGRRSTADHPYGPLAGGASYPVVTRTEMMRTSGAAVVGEVLSISNPHFNTDDGGVRIHPEGGIDGDPIQDVRVRIVERWADRLGLPEVFDLVVFGGQVEFLLTDDQAAAARLPKGGRFITGREPSVELAVGERALLFITKVDIGWVGGGRQALVVSHKGKFVIAGDRVGGTPASELKEEIRRELGADCPDGPAAGRCPQ